MRGCVVEACVCEPLTAILKGKLAPLVKEEKRERLPDISCTNVNNPKTKEGDSDRQVD